MNSEFRLPSMCYISDATVNNAETLFNGESPNITSLIDLISIVQAAVLNEWLVTSTMALKRSSLLQELDFADTFHVSEQIDGEDTVFNITPPKGFEKDNTPVVIDEDEQGELCSNSAVGELFLACAWSEMLQDDDILGSLFIPERLPEGARRGDSYMAKFAGFMLWLQANRNITKFENEGARQHFTQLAEEHLQRYRLLSHRLIACRDRFGLDLTCSVIEEPLFSLSVAQEVNSPFEYLEKFDVTVHEALVAMRKEAFEKWHFPSVGAAVLAKTERLNDLPTQIKVARSKLLKARSKIRAQNIEVLSFEREMNLGNDKHFRELNELKVTLQKALQAFGSDTEYQAELEAFPLTERIWWLPKLLTSAIGAMKSPDKALADISAMHWLRRQSYLRYVPGMRGASSYAKKTRIPIMEHLIKNILRLDWNKANLQSQTVGWAMDLTERCSDLRSTDKIENKVLVSLKDENGEETSVKEDVFWGMLSLNDSLKKLFLLGNES
jgi:hypothetical protein